MSALLRTLADSLTAKDLEGSSVHRVDCAQVAPAARVYRDRAPADATHPPSRAGFPYARTPDITCLIHRRLDAGYHFCSSFQTRPPRRRASDPLLTT
jgi:hypothetical protein